MTFEELVLSYHDMMAAGPSTEDQARFAEGIPSNLAGRFLSWLWDRHFFLQRQLKREVN